MSTHPSLRDRRFAITVVKGSHPGQAKRSARKKELRRLKEADDKQKAAQLGISVGELRHRRYLRTLQILAEERTRQERERWATEEYYRRMRGC